MVSVKVLRDSSEQLTSVPLLHPTGQALNAVVAFRLITVCPQCPSLFTGVKNCGKQSVLCAEESQQTKASAHWPEPSDIKESLNPSGYVISHEEVLWLMLINA
jgi:hypothetical protein